MLLLDTHTFLWWVGGNVRLSAPARAVIGDPSVAVHVSAATIWEIATKHRLGKLEGAAAIAPDLPGAIGREGFRDLPVTIADAAHAGALPGAHRDPFDRLLVAQALLRDWELVSNDTLLDAFGVRRLW